MAVMRVSIGGASIKSKESKSLMPMAWTEGRENNQVTALRRKETLNSTLQIICMGLWLSPIIQFSGLFLQYHAVPLPSKTIPPRQHIGSMMVLRTSCLVHKCDRTASLDIKYVSSLPLSQKRGKTATSPSSVYWVKVPFVGTQKDDIRLEDVYLWRNKTHSKPVYFICPCLTETYLTQEMHTAHKIPVFQVSCN